MERVDGIPSPAGQIAGSHRACEPAARVRSRRMAAAIFASVAAVASAALDAAQLRREKPVAAPALALKDVNGRDHRLADYRGSVLVLNFWATWCEPCREEMPSLDRLAARFEGRAFAVLAVDVGEGEGRVNAFLDKVPVRFPVLLDRDSAVMKAWGVRVLPTTLVVDAQQRIRFRVVGEAAWDAPDLVAELSALVPRASGRSAGPADPSRPAR